MNVFGQKEKAVQCSNRERIKQKQVFWSLALFFPARPGTSQAFLHTCWKPKSESVYLQE